MKELNAKKDLRFALVWISAYVFVMSVFENIYQGNISQSWRALPACALLLALWLSMRRENSFSIYGFVSMASIHWKATLYLIPMILITTANLWRGAVLRFEISETVFYIISMMAIGFIEEILFRGFLLRALMNQSIKKAIIISSITFGLGHIVNLANGAEVIPTLLQLIYACAIGLMLSVFVVQIGNIIPCCLFHGIFNALAAFGNEAGQTVSAQALSCFIISVAAIGYALWLSRVPRQNKAVL